MDAAEIGVRLGAGRSRAHAIARQKGFPDPYQTLRMGSVWDADDVEAWIRENRPELAEEPEGE